MAKSNKKPLEVLLHLSEKTSEKLFLFLTAFQWRKAAKATRPIPLSASGRLKAASGDYAGLQANRPRRWRFQPSGRSFAIGTKSGITLRRKEKEEVKVRYRGALPYINNQCRRWRHNKSALSFDAEKEGAGCGAFVTG